MQLFIVPLLIVCFLLPGISSSVDGDICRLLISLEFFVCSLLSSNPDDWLLRLFGEQDDDLFESLLCLLDIIVLTKEKR